MLKTNRILREIYERDELERQTFYDLTGSTRQTTDGLRADGGVFLLHLVRGLRPAERRRG